MPDELTTDRVRDIAREEVEHGWEQMGVDASSTAGRLEHASLLAWVRERKRIRESSSDKVRLTVIGGLATAIVTALTTWAATFGFHR